MNATNKNRQPMMQITQRVTSRKWTPTRRMLSKNSWQEQLSKLSRRDSCSVRSRIGWTTSSLIICLCVFGLFCLSSNRNIRKAADKSEIEHSIVTYSDVMGAHHVVDAYPLTLKVWPDGSSNRSTGHRSYSGNCVAVRN